MPRFKVEILLNEEKILADHEYKPETLYTYIRDMFRQYHLKEVQTETPNHIIFVDRGTNKDMAGLACAAIDLSEMDWFRKYTDEFYWCEPDKYGNIHRSSIYDELHSIPTMSKRKVKVKKPSRFKVEILLDEEKIIADHEYKPETLYKYIRDMFRQYHLKEKTTNSPNHIIFVDKGNDKDYGGFWNGIWELYGQSWFKKYALKCLWFDKNEDEPEDVLKEAAEFEKRNRL